MGGLRKAGINQRQEDMQVNIPSSYLSHVYPYSGTANRWALQKGSQEPAFAKYLDLDRQRQKMREQPPNCGLPSVYMQFVEDYKAWKTRQPVEPLPDSLGWTEENLAFLQERYSGSLSSFEIYDALETMREMGILSEKAENCATGSHAVVMHMEGGVYKARVGADSKEAWLHGFDEAPMTGFHSLDGILSWAREFREEDYPDFITGAEATARGWI